jgi:competence protein ComEA
MEGRGLLRGAVLLALLSVVRFALAGSGDGSGVLPAGEDDLGPLLEETRAARAEEERRSTPLAPKERLDPNRAPARELDRLPGVGPSTARAVVEHREEEGGFRRPEDLLAVRGIGPATLAKIHSSLDFSRGVPADLRRQGGRSAREAGRDGAAASSAVPLTGGGTAGAGGAGGWAGSRPALTTPAVDVNRASAAELETLPGIGPALARRIMESRAEDGPFRTADDLLRVRGIGPATLERIRGLVRAGG